MIAHRLRRLVLALTASIGLLWSASAAAQVREVVDDLGHRVLIPVRPQRIAATNSEHVAPGIVELGADLVAVTGRVHPAMNGGKPFMPAMWDALDFRLETSGVAYIGLQGTFDIEALAAAKPDLILARSQEAPRRDDLMKIAPTLLLNDFPGIGGLGIERYRLLADIVGRLDRFNEMNALWQERLTRNKAVLVERIGDPARLVVAHITANAAGIRLVNNTGMLDELFWELGFSYPPLAAGGTTMPAGGRPANVDLSAELLPQLQTDFLFTRSYINMAPSGSGTVIKDTLDFFDRAAPGWKPFVHAAKNGQHIFIELGQMESNTFAARKYTLDYLMTNIAYRPFVKVGDGVPRVPIRAATR